MLFLGVATFFEGYDTFVLSFVLALVLGDLGGTEAQAGWIRAITGLGAVVKGAQGMESYLQWNKLSALAEKLIPPSRRAR